MAVSPPQLNASYWQNLKIQPQDLEALSAYLLELETPLTPAELAVHLVKERFLRESEELSKQQAALTEAYLPKNRYEAEQELVFPGLDGAKGKVLGVRPARIPNGRKFDVVQVEFEDGKQREFASGLDEHVLNKPPEAAKEDPANGADAIVETHAKSVIPTLEAALRESEDFVYIAGRWFPKALIVDVPEGQLNVAEALLDMAGGGPLSTEELLADVELPEGINPKLATFSLDLALQEDERFDEVGPTGMVAWYLHRQEPEAVRKTPVFLRYRPIEHDRTVLNEDMLNLEQHLDDELSPIKTLDDPEVRAVEVRLIFPHWRAGTFPLTDKMARLFPTAYESPRVKFDFVDGDGGEHFQGWVVRHERYVHGLREWYERRGLMPGSYVRARLGDKPGEIVVEADAHRSSKEWVRTALIGADGGVVFATLKQSVETSFDERMMVYMPSETQALDAAWQRPADKRRSLEQVIKDSLSELAKLNPQGHMHASELYAVVNVVMRCPPAPILALLATQAGFVHVGDLHYRLAGSQLD